MLRKILSFLLVPTALALVRGDALSRPGQLSVPATGSNGSVPTFAGNAQHTAIYETPAQDLNAIHWSTPIDLNPGEYAHYGAPLITAANTVLVPVKTAGDGFKINAFNGAGGSAKYTLTTDYILPDHDWTPVYQPVLADVPAGLRLYYPGAGGTIFYIDNPDSNSPGTPVRKVFYTSLANYLMNAAGFNATIFINTPITADNAGNVFFGFRVQGTAPPPLNTTQSGFARIDPNGKGTYVLAGTAANDGNISRDSHNSAPALSSDGSTLYVVVKGSDAGYCYLLGLDTTTLATRYRVFLRDPRNGNANPASVPDDGTASPTVAPDGDVYFGILGNPFNGSRGFLLRFSGDLTVEKTPGGFGWDYTAAIVPSSMAPLYTGSSPYLIFSKYNNYLTTGDGGDGVNKIALLDPNATEVDPHASSNGMLIMREVQTVAGPTPDSENPDVPDAVREWCINTAAVNPASNSVFTPSEDGHIYRWNLATNSLSQLVPLTEGIGEPYVPTVIGPDGVVYTLNGGTLFALGGLNGVGVVLSSSLPDVRGTVAGQPLTFTAAVSNTGGGGPPTGTVTFRDTVYFVIGFDQLGSTTTVLATVPLDASGHASCTTSALSAANHFVTAAYSGDANFSGGSASLVQKVHAHASSTTLTSSVNPSALGQAVTFTGAVASSPPGFGTPSGMVTFQEGTSVLAQVPLSGGAASFTTSALAVGSHVLTAVYSSDTAFASSSGNVTQVVQGTAPPPVITGFTPSSGAAGTSVTISGSNFVDVMSVRFNGASASFVVNSPGQITAVVPADASTGGISVTAAAGTATSAGIFTVLPTITGFTPGSGGPGVSVTITGTAFTGATSVKFNGTPAGFTVASASQINATVPAGATSGPLSVTTPDGTATSAASFLVAPRITSFSPSSGGVGTSVTISGANFTGTTSVRFNGVSAAYSVGSSTSISATVPSGASTGRISVTAPGGSATSAGDFTVNLLPVITGFSPTSGAAGAQVTIMGSNFTGTSSVKFNGTSAGTYTVNSNTQITATVPNNATTGKISVTNAVGTGTSGGDFTVAPRITGFSPGGGPVGTAVNINGLNFTPATSVRFNGVAASFTVNTATRITATVPPLATTGKISVIAPAGTGISSNNFTVKPAVTGFTPTSGGVGASVTVTGTTFGGTTSVKFNGTSAAAYHVDSATQITATVPAKATTGPISVTTPDGTGTSAGNFTVAPRISDFSPSSGPPGTSVTISGANFTGATSVRFNGVSAPFTVNSSSRITATVPGAATTGRITVSTPAGTAASATDFIVQ